MAFGKRAVAACATASALTLGTTVAAAAPAGSPRYSAGDDGAGDPYFPQAGNGGIDVEHYDLDLTYLPPADDAALAGRLEGTATLTVRATEDLDRFNLDLRGLSASSVMVDGRRARYGQDGHELTITPRPKLKTGTQAEVVVDYAGTTTRPVDVGGALYGWVTTADGAIVVNEPDGAPTWYPANDHPTDKASYTFAITVPEGLTAAANGLLEGTETRDGWTTWRWDAPDQMASYLATATIGDFTVRRSTTTTGVPVIDFLDEDLSPGDRELSLASLALTDEMMTFFEDVYGEYPFVSYGAVVDDDSVGYALEAQTRSVFSRAAAEPTAAHELAHSWVGNAVSPASWRDIWLNEGWATYSEWLWTEHRGGTTAQARFDAVMAVPEGSFWELPIADPGAVDMFAGAVYDRGAATLHALRGTIGDEAFFALARAWVARYDDSAATTADFEALAEQVSGQELGELFDVWLRSPQKPTDW